MAQNAKIALSAEELHLLQNKDWILTKRSLLQKADALLGMALPGLQALVATHEWIPTNQLGVNAKIHRGENYQGLPYVILDYPACFSKKGNFALRSMLWWGHFFSVTLQVSGIYKAAFEDNLLKNIQLLQQPDISICTGLSEWEHHFGTDNYTDADTLNILQLEQLVRKMEFVKLATKTDLGQWDSMPAIIVQQASILLNLLAP